MVQGIEKRTYHRFEIPDSSLLYKKIGLFHEKKSKQFDYSTSVREWVVYSVFIILDLHFIKMLYFTVFFMNSDEE